MGYNGHKNWNHWNVAFWISNDEGLYRTAREILSNTTHKGVAVNRMMWELEEMGITRTPDGAPYTKTSVRAAMRDL